jgi:hypothetical protein
MTPTEKLQTLLTLAFAELDAVKRDASDQRLRADERLADAAIAARRIGLPVGTDSRPERDGVDALEWAAMCWQEAAGVDDAETWQSRYLDAKRQLDIARGALAAGNARDLVAGR